VADWQQQLAELRAQRSTAVSLMTSPVITIPATASLRQAAQQMAAHDSKRLPVVDGNGRLAGWISRIDILRTLEYHQPATVAESEPPATGTTIAELMYRDVPTVSLQATLEQIVQALEQNRRRRAIVVDDEQRILGIISDGDLLRRSQQEAHSGILDRLRRLVTGQPAVGPAALLAATETAADLMTTPVITIPVDASPTTALRLMVQNGVKWLPVVNENGRLMGLLGRASLLRGLLAAGGTANEE